MIATVVAKINIENIRNWIFVTGVIRSGTTFVGKVLSFPWNVDYIHEPFHGGYTLPDREYLQPRYIQQGNDSEELQAYRDRINALFRYDIAMRTSRYKKDSRSRKITKHFVGSRGPFYLRLAKLNPFHTAAVIKDPVGKMLTEELYLHFGVRPVIVVKHPVSLMASLKRVGWWPDVREFAEQPHLVEDYFADEESFLKRPWPDLVRRSAAHWRATYKVLLAQASKYPDWQVVTHETLSLDPLNTFQTLFQNLDLRWSKSVARRITSLTRGNESADSRGGRVQDFRRNSSEIFEARRESLSKAERRAIYEVVEDVALQLYTRESFSID